MRNIFTLVTVAAALSIGATAQAKNLVLNGGFEDTLESGSHGIGSLYPADEVTDWTTTGYNFVFNPGTADTTGATGEYGLLKLWGPGDGSNNGLTAASPAGGNFIGADGAYQTEPISQDISGLMAGKTYTVKFYWAGAQQYGYTGATTENWTVSLGDESHTTVTAMNANHGFTGWMAQSFQFTASGADETLSFLAHGTPNGEPPFSLLDGVSLTEGVPEPATWTMMILGVAGIGAMARRRRAMATVAAA